MLVKSVEFMWVIGLQKLLTFGAIRLVNEEFISKKTRQGIPPKFLESPSSETTGPIEKINRVQKWYRYPLSSCKVWWRSTAAWPRVTSFCFFFVCHALDLELE